MLDNDNMAKRAVKFDFLEKAIDFLFPIFKGFLSKQVYRYLAAGGICFAINCMIFHLSYYFSPFNFGYYFSKHTISLLASMSITIFVGFYLNRKFVFYGSDLNRRKQFFRYTSSTILGTISSILLMDLFIDIFHWNVTISFLSNIILIQLLNFFVQRHFSFSVR